MITSLFVPPIYYAFLCHPTARCLYISAITALDLVAIVTLGWGAHIALMLEAVMGVAYASGVGVYVGRIPERWRPGEFDLVGHSHQIFHVLVLVGALTHYAAMKMLLDWRLRSMTSCNALCGAGFVS
ncbi:hypothetical protein Cni_G23350 [Canna indica]|uniref:Uncharacterized protein n=1 Tax=Canna indica TaxID=4628 RepID=A0AAQ3KU81_9LILI|nr:hypothetical protein Cni_G23350 [Canna indica]